jgi:hypothetical protein
VSRLIVDRIHLHPRHWIMQKCSDVGRTLFLSVRSSDYTTSNGRINREKWIVKDVEGSESGLTWSITSEFSGDEWGNPQMYLSGQPSSGRNLNSLSHEYKAGVLSTGQRCSAFRYYQVAYHSKCSLLFDNIYTKSDDFTKSGTLITGMSIIKL